MANKEKRAVQIHAGVIDGMAPQLNSTVGTEAGRRISSAWIRATVCYYQEGLIATPVRGGQERPSSGRMSYDRPRFRFIYRLGNTPVKARGVHGLEQTIQRSSLARTLNASNITGVWQDEMVPRIFSCFCTPPPLAYNSMAAPRSE